MYGKKGGWVGRREGEGRGRGNVWWCEVRSCRVRSNVKGMAD
jgi:hypothetical protein